MARRLPLPPLTRSKALLSHPHPQPKTLNPRHAPEPNLKKRIKLDDKEDRHERRRRQ